MKKIKVLQLIATNDPGGAESVVRDLCCSFVDSPVACSVALAGGGWLGTELERNGVDYEIFKYNPFIDFPFLKKISKYISQKDIDIVHCHMSQLNILGSFMGFFHRLPTIMTVHGITNDFDSNRQILFYKIAIKFCAKIVFVSSYLKNEFFNKVKHNHEKGEVIYNGVDLENFRDNRDGLHCSQKQRTAKIVAIGNLLPVKDYVTLIRSCKLLQDNNCCFSLDIVGEGPEKDNIEFSIKEYGLEGNVKLLGFRDNIPEILNSADLYVISSVHEGFSISTIEAMSTGLPVVATRCGGPEEIVEHNRTGFLVDKKDFKDMAMKMDRLIKNRKMRTDFGDQGRSRVNEMFSIATMKKSYLNIYHKILR